MVYNNNLVVVIKNNGKVLREFKGNVVKLPFGSDYSIYIKNKDSLRRALVTVKVDGKDVMDSHSLIIDKNSATELKGFMKGTTVNNTFRFIEKTKEISNYRGNFPEDGLVEVIYKFEEYVDTRPVCPIRDYIYITNYKQIFPYEYMPMYGSSTCCSTTVNDSGITVPGKEISQDFVVDSIGTLEDITYSIIINLKGVHIRNKTKKCVKTPITVKTKLRCPTCGRLWTSSMKYCGNCGTYL